MSRAISLTNKTEFDLTIYCDEEKVFLPDTENIHLPVGSSYKFCQEREEMFYITFYWQPYEMEWVSLSGRYIVDQTGILNEENESYIAEWVRVD